jgi:hypothetical protein
MVSIKFDQADIDVAEASFQPITADDKLVPSQIAIQWTVVESTEEEKT